MIEIERIYGRRRIAMRFALRAGRRADRLLLNFFCLYLLTHLCRRRETAFRKKLRTGRNSQIDANKFLNRTQPCIR
jgi:hypothetical protein